jgi:hypothetical protein
MPPPLCSNLVTTKMADKWEGHDANAKTWTEWKHAYLAAYIWGINRQHAGAIDELFTRAANNIMPFATDVAMDARAALWTT